jgi:hypothetical protein
MKFYKYLVLVLATIALTTSCQDDDSQFGEVIAPTNLQLDFTIQGVDMNNPEGDGSGLVVFDATSDNALNYTYDFGDGRTGTTSSGTITHQFVTQGVNTYNVTVTATGTGGIPTTSTISVEVFSAFNDIEAREFLTGNSTKTWYWAASEPGHLGVGPNNGNADDGNNFFPQFFAAAPFQLSGAPCFYEDQLVFTLNGEEINYELINNGQTFFNAAFTGTGQDECLDNDTSGVKLVTLIPSESIVPDDQKRGTTMSFSDGGFMSYFIDATEYEILSISENRLEVRAIQNNDLAWYHIFTTDDPLASSGPSENGTLIFSDEFDTNGAPDPAKWTFDTGTGNDGFGNNESQFYTDRPSNITVEDGILQITARRENFQNRQFTSSRIKTEGLFNFTYGQIEARAKLPTGGGTWPAIWSLGSDYQTNPWPAAGEIDFMEHVGNRQDEIFASVHHPGAFGGDADTSSSIIPGVSEEFHVYRTEWTATEIKFFVDGEQIHQVANNDSLPFNKDFFLIMNVAMGGNFGGDIDPNFTESSMEVDYIRVYQ